MSCASPIMCIGPTIRGFRGRTLRGVYAANHADYLAEIEAQARGGPPEYDLLVLPGLELSYNDLDPYPPLTQSPSVPRFVAWTTASTEALVRARGEGAALVPPSVSATGQYLPAPRCGSRAVALA